MKKKWIFFLVCSLLYLPRGNVHRLYGRTREGTEYKGTLSGKEKTADKLIIKT